MADFKHITQITTRMYLEGYKQIGSGNRIVAVRALLAGWHDSPYDDQLIKGGKVLAEYGGAIEELFAFAYAVHHQCSAISTDAEQADAEFMETMFAYDNKGMHDFIKSHDFEANFQSLYGLPEPQIMGKEKGLAPEIIVQGWKEIGGTIEDIKSSFYENGLKDIYNKLKHPFLVLSPSLHPGNARYLLPVITKPQDEHHIATIYPAKVDWAQLSDYLTNLQHIRDAISGLIMVMEYKAGPCK